ncbi:glycosyltransferase family 61 protein [Luteirhabdus pelagi]|jgi:capsular polysaccharide biosynthesis protein|uniref:glycosyltransferase family 61 protein n=1 Tax=Luteirhabdus pelagi TaxID=2792783 RepID=UPI0019395366|nr:glycosyltransferase family 61 protein [Luteirhabdus pelagi]
MEGFFKKLKAVLKVNQSLSSLFEKNVSTVPQRDKNSPECAVLHEPYSISIDFSNYHIPKTPYWQKFEGLKSASLFYCEFEKASIVSKGIVVSNEGDVLLESTIFQQEYLNELHSNHLIVGRKWLPTKNVGKVLPLLNRLDNNYYHWTLESLSRALLVYEQPFFKDYSVVLKKDGAAFMKESLQFLFGISEDRIIEKDILSVLKPLKTLVVSFPHIRGEQTTMANVYYPDMIRKLNALAHSKLKQKGNVEGAIQNILISRKNAISRRILNEDEVLKALQPLAFEPVCLEELSYEAQVRLFTTAKRVLAIHGAGITNVIYGRKLRLVELYPEERNARDPFYFAQITAALGFEHLLLEYSSDNKNEDVMVSKPIIDKIKKFLA